MTDLSNMSTLDFEDFYFKKTLFGNVLMVNEPHRRTDNFYIRLARKATKEDVEFYLSNVEVLKQQNIEFHKIRRDHPEIFI